MSVLDFPHKFTPGEDPAPFSAPRINAYRRAGWTSVIPLPYGKQDPPPSGYTGRKAERASKEKLLEWIENAKVSRQGAANLAIVHGPLTIAIDVDHYTYVDRKTEKTKEKTGGDSLAALEIELGPLPRTWRSTARGTDNPSGQRFFRLAPEHATNILDYDDKPGPHIEIVRWGHRYSVVWPSLNGRRGEIYKWYKETSDGSLSEVESGTVPEVSELPLLPVAWVNYLTRGYKKFQDVAIADLSDGEEDEWVLARPNSTGQMCAAMQKSLDGAIEELPNGAHDAARDRLMHMMWLAWEGHSGLSTAAGKLREAFLEEVSGRRSEGAAAAEWYREYRGAVARAAARTDGGATACACFYADADGSDGKGASTDPAKYERNDDGNAEHLLDLYGEDMKWVEGFKSWMVWDEEAGHWQLDTKGYSTLLARTVAPRLKQAAQRLWNAAAAQDEESPEQKRLMRNAGELAEWARQAGMRTRLTAMLDVAKSYDGVTVPMGDWDMKPEVLICKGGTLELLPRGTEEGVRWRESRREDLAMLSTNLEYVPWSELRRGGGGAGLLGGKAVWEDYLATFLPDPELRWFVQRLLGYSLFGANPERKLVFFQGATSTGKSTILEAASAAMGRYGGTFNLSMFRESQDAGPRPDLVIALPRRLVVATESDSDWNLNADTIKRLVGGTDQVQARNLHSNDMVERIPAFMPIVASNSAPTIQGADAALWRRLIAVPFDRQIPEKANKKHVAWELANRLDCKMAVLSWIVEGYTGYAREGLDNLPPAVESRGKRFRAGVSDWHSFMAEAVEEHPGARVQVQDIYLAYRTWGLMNDISDRQLMNKRQFEAKLVPSGYKVVRRKTGKGENKANFVLDWRFRVADEEFHDEESNSSWMNKFSKRE